jgi:hypothetical protein
MQTFAQFALKRGCAIRNKSQVHSLIKVIIVLRNGSDMNRL